MAEAGLADLLLGKYVLAFEAVSVLLLAALIGALALVRPHNLTGNGSAPQARRLSGVSRPGVTGPDAD